MSELSGLFPEQRRGHGSPWNDGDSITQGKGAARSSRRFTTLEDGDDPVRRQKNFDASR